MKPRLVDHSFQRIFCDLSLNATNSKVETRKVTAFSYLYSAAGGTRTRSSFSIKYEYRFTEYEYDFEAFDGGDQREVSIFSSLFVSPGDQNIYCLQQSTCSTHMHFHGFFAKLSVVVSSHLDGIVGCSWQRVLQSRLRNRPRLRRRRPRSLQRKRWPNWNVWNLLAARSFEAA